MSLTRDQILHQAIAARAARDLQRAERLLRQCLSIDPKDIDALNRLGLLAQEVGNIPAAITLLKQAADLRPDLPMLHNNLADAYRRHGQPREAEACYHRAISADPSYARAYANLGCLAMDRQSWDEAEKLQRRAIELEPSLPQAHNNLGEILRRRGELKGAEQSYRSAIEADANYALAHSNLGGVLMQQDRVDEAIACLEHAVAARPDFASGHNNLAHVLVSLGRLDEARQRFQKAIELQPNYADAHFNLGLLFLLQGDWNRGFAEWEWRWGLASAPKRSARLLQGAWNGENLENQTLLLYAEQGLGDTLQCLRYIPQVAQCLRGQTSKILIACPSELVRLAANSIPSFAGASAEITHVVPINAQMPEFHAHVPLMSLPRIFRTTPQTIPAMPGYLQASPAGIESWAARLRGAMLAASHPSTAAPPLKVGLAWAGNPSHRNDRHRSISPQLLAGLAAAARSRPIQFISLQKYLDRPALPPPRELGMIDLTADLRDFADTAALIANLDLVISIDTAVIHVAGAMSRPVWVLLPHAPDWRWGLTGDKTPWYPTMRLFRQSARGDWQSPIDRAARELANW